MPKSIYTRDTVVFKRRKGGRRKIFLSPKFIFIGLGLASASFIFYFLFFSYYFQISEVKVGGIETLNRDSVLAEISAFLQEKSYKIFPGNNWFLARDNDLAAILYKDFPKVNSVTVQKKFFRILEIKLQERKMAAIWCKAVLNVEDSSFKLPPEEIFVNSCYFLDKFGVIFEEAPGYKGTSTLIIEDASQGALVPKLGMKIIDPEAAEKFSSFKKRLEEELGLVSESFKKFEKEFRVGVITQDNLYFDIYLDAAKNTNDQFLALKETLGQMSLEEKGSLQYIDLRFGNRVYYK